MKVRSMNFDQYKISIEAHPLEVLYSKYNTNDVNSQYQTVRPLGRIRQERRSSSECQHTGINQISAFGETGISGNRNMKLNSRIHSERLKFRNDRNISSLELHEKENENVNNSHQSFAGLTRSKTQDFENKFKIAAARANGQESPSPILKPAKRFQKKIVHLPLFRINLRTDIGDADVSRTVAKTRESLRKLMDLNKAKLRNANIITANITNYEFSAPQTSVNTARESNITSPRNLLSQPFHAKPILKASRDREREPRNRQHLFMKNFQKVNTQDNNNTFIDTSNNDNSNQERHLWQKRNMSDIIGPDDEPDASFLSLAIRPETSLTIGATMNQIDGVIKSPTSEELKELSDVLKGSESQPAWPSVEDIQAMIARNNSRTTKSRTTFSRPATVLNNVAETPEENYINQFDDFYRNYNSNHFKTPKPVLRYTSKESTYKLDPIIVPSHTCTECPMCNLYQRDVETPCPPNTPNTSQFALEPGSQGKPVIVRGTKLHTAHTTQQEVLRISRINMNGRVSPTEDNHVLSYMKG